MSWMRDMGTASACITPLAPRAVTQKWRKGGPPFLRSAVMSDENRLAIRIKDSFYPLRSSPSMPSTGPTNCRKGSMVKTKGWTKTEGLKFVTSATHQPARPCIC